MAKTIIIGKNGKRPVKVKSKSKSNEGIVGKPVVFRASKQGTQIAGVVKSVKDGVAEVSLALPNSDGLLIVAKDSTTTIPVKELSTVDAVTITNRDVKMWNSSQPVTNQKAQEVLNADKQVIDYRDVTFDGFASTFVGTTPEDRDGDYIMDGAFRNTLRQFKENPVMLTDHMRMVKHMMGSYSKVSTTNQGLAVTGNITNSQHQDAIHTRALVAEGHLKTLSIGGAFFYTDDYRGIEEIRLYEISLVVVPANPDAQIQVRSISTEFVEKAFEHHAKTHGGEIRFK